MKKIYVSILTFCLIISLNSCAVIGGIFKAGAAVGVLAVVVVVALIIWIISLMRGKSQ
ncbi:phosphatidate cytidylyltransferase [Mucilaginibacter agri]|uniref:Phosphatidate cytidylyltransferase n=1 Tax=Mucilaginibacter agri TaxID=2695265 RepID=A0A965ZE12_9SPHI|nr:phosphatidate cytidylyltransferase [Mucilaginibacter agri]NCD68367.1 phosphatidate cytidylyltransferase [Mucilaginibacter agri]